MEDDFKIWDIDNLRSSKIEDFEFIEQALTIYGFKLKFKAETIEYSVNFKRYLSFRISDESTLLEYWDILPDNCQGYPFFIVDNSSYLKTLKFLSKNFFTGPEEEYYKHYCLFFEDDCIEIVTDQSPEIEKLNE